MQVLYESSTELDHSTVFLDATEVRRRIYEQTGVDPSNNALYRAFARTPGVRRTMGGRYRIPVNALDAVAAALTGRQATPPTASR